jgi:hypothetical protein
MKQQQKQDLAEATRLLIQENDVDGAADALKKVKLSKEIQAQHAILPNSRCISSVFALLCIAIVSVLQLCPHPNPRVHLDLHVEAAVFRLAQRKDFSWRASQGQKAESILLDGLIEIEAPGLGLSGTTERLLADGANMTLRRITISKGSRLEIERGKDGISLYIYEGDVQGVIELQDSRLRLVLNGQREIRTVSESLSDSPVPESLSFKSVDNSGHRLHLRLETSGDWRMYGLQATGMIFQRESPPDSNTFVSAVLGGIVELPEIKGRKTALLEHDWLHITKADSTRLHLDFPADRDSFNLLFQGRVGSITAGPDDSEQDLAPSLLTWLYHQKQLTFFWGALFFVYGLLSNMRFMFKKR